MDLLEESSNVLDLLGEVGMFDSKTLVFSRTKEGRAGDILGDTSFVKRRD